jgi:starvation-inducible outer membrane lipoprotein
MFDEGFINQSSYLFVIWHASEYKLWSVDISFEQSTNIVLGYSDLVVLIIFKLFHSMVVFCIYYLKRTAE